MEINWITLDPDDERGKRFVRECERFGIRQRPFIAERGSTFNLRVDARMRAKLRKSQLGCLSSHMEMLRRASAMAGTGKDWFFVCEDDADLGWMDFWGFSWDDLLAEIPPDADFVVLHAHPKPLLDAGKMAKFFEAKTPMPAFVRGMATYTALAYLVRPSAAKKVADIYYDKKLGKWAGLPAVPVDVFFSGLDTAGVLTMYTIPVLGDMGLLDSALTRSKITLRMRRAGGEFMSSALADPRGHSTTVRNSLRMAAEVAKEFGKELSVAGLILVGIGVFMVMK